MIGQTVSHYRILAELGRGGMGIVYKAEDTKLKREVALKFLPPHAREADEERARFVQEAQAAAALNHPNICTIYGIEEADDKEFIEMELVDGVTLRQKLPLKKVDDAIDHAIQIAEALQEAHSKGIVHRDIKAENIMVNSRNQIKVMDFGLAKLKGTVRLTKTSSTVGTLAYMAPEQIGGGDVDARADLFSFGVLIFEMLTGRMPFRGEHEAATIYSIMNEEPEPLTKYLPEAPPALVVLLGKALEKDPAERYQSAGEMLVDLKRLKKASSHSSKHYQVQQQSSGSSPSGTAAQSTLPSKGKWKIALLAGALVVIGAVIVVLTRKDERVLPSVNNVKMSRLTASGDAGFSAISPDGKYVVYQKGEPGKWGLWIRQVVSSTDVMIIPPSDIKLDGSVFSNDGNYLFYTASLPGSPVPTVYRIPVLGGAPPRKIVSNVVGSVTLSPGDDRIAFLRGFPSTGEEAIFVANADGSDEKKLISRDGKELFYMSEGGAPAWSPDGALIACPAGSTTDGFSVGIVVIPVDEPRETMVTSDNWNDVGRIAWYPDGSGLVFCGRKKGEPSQIFFLSYPGGEVSRITNDLYGYGPTSLSVTRDGKAIVSAQSQTFSSITVVRDGVAREVTRGATRADGLGGLVWTRDGRILYTSTVGSIYELWTSGLDGSENRQVTFGEAVERDPATDFISGDIYYVMSDKELPNIWKMGSNGENPVRITNSEDYNPDVSRDGKWLLFDSWKAGSRALWKLELGSGDSAMLFRPGGTSPKISPDGRLVTCLFHDEQEQRERMAILSFSTGDPVSVFDLPLTSNRDDFEWSPDGKSIHYVDTRNGVSNIWAYDYQARTSRQVTSFESDRIFGFAWSKDGTSVAVARGATTSDLVLLTVAQ